MTCFVILAKKAQSKEGKVKINFNYQRLMFGFFRTICAVSVLTFIGQN